MIPLIDLRQSRDRPQFDACLARLRATADSTGQLADAAARVIDDVASRGDAAVVEQEQKWTDPNFTADRIRVTGSELDQARDELDPQLAEAIEQAIANVRRYQQHVMPSPPASVKIGGAELGLRFTPMDSAGLLVPGGSAVLFSTLIMLAVPAQVAGVPTQHLAVAHPAPTRREGKPARDISPVFKAVAAMLGIPNVYRIGGAHGVAALAMGTETVQPVDMLAGPGHPIVQIAKARLAGRVGIDGFYGPSEVVTIADDSAPPPRVAADLIAQAEHDPGKCFLIAWSDSVIEAITSELHTQLAQRQRRDAIERALADDSAIIRVADTAQAVDIANELAAEHVSLAVADPDAWLARLRHAGEIFLGHSAPVAAGDYYAGPSHCLPTGTTARFTSGVSAYTFLKRTGTVAYPAGMPREAIEHIARLAEAEALDAHAASVRTRAE